MTKILFLIHDLGQGGAEKVLVNLVNNMDQTKFDISVIALFGSGINEQFLKPHIHYQTVFKKSFPGNSKLMKLFSPELLYKFCVKEKYDIEVAYLEGPAARIISGCTDPNIKLVSWIHCTMYEKRFVAASFRSIHEAEKCYSKFHKIVFVSEGVRSAFYQNCNIENKSTICYNTNDTLSIKANARESVEPTLFRNEEIKLCGVGKIVSSKGFDKLAHIHCRLRKEGYPVHTYILGVGDGKANIEAYLKGQGEEATFTFLGYQTNPYKFIARCDLFVCASIAEGFSTAATEALIVGTPVCTTDVSGMKEMLGDHNEFGIITENSEEALYQGIKQLVDNPALLAHYKAQAMIRGKAFSTENTVSAVEQMLLDL